MNAHPHTKHTLILNIHKVYTMYLPLVKITLAKWCCAFNTTIMAFRRGCGSVNCQTKREFGKSTFVGNQWKKQVLRLYSRKLCYSLELTHRAEVFYWCRFKFRSISSGIYYCVFSLAFVVLSSHVIKILQGQLNFSTGLISLSLVVAPYCVLAASAFLAPGRRKILGRETKLGTLPQVTQLVQTICHAVTV